MYRIHESVMRVPLLLRFIAGGKGKSEEKGFDRKGNPYKEHLDSGE